MRNTREEIINRAYELHKHFGCKKLSEIKKLMIPDFETALFFAAQYPEIWEQTVPDERLHECITPRGHLIHAARAWVASILKKEYMLA